MTRFTITRNGEKWHLELPHDGRSHEAVTLSIVEWLLTVMAEWPDLDVAIVTGQGEMAIAQLNMHDLAVGPFVFAIDSGPLGFAVVSPA